MIRLRIKVGYGRGRVADGFRGSAPRSTGLFEDVIVIAVLRILIHKTDPI